MMMMMMFRVHMCVSITIIHAQHIHPLGHVPYNYIYINNKVAKSSPNGLVGSLLGLHLRTGSNPVRICIYPVSTGLDEFRFGSLSLFVNQISYTICKFYDYLQYNLV